MLYIRTTGPTRIRGGHTSEGAVRRVARYHSSLRPGETLLIISSGTEMGGVEARFRGGREV